VEIAESVQTVTLIDLVKGVVEEGVPSGDPSDLTG
jgi:hypothetical protein